jgi:hypothetical protein
MELPASDSESASQNKDIPAPDRCQELKIQGAAAALPAPAVLGGPNFSAARAAAGEGELEPIELPKPEMDGGKSVLAALKDRKTVRNINSFENSSTANPAACKIAFSVPLGIVVPG